MAGDWIKIKTSLIDDPAVIGISIALGLDGDLVVGKLVRIWSWANHQTEDGHAVGVTPDWVDRFLDCQGFAQAMEKVGWLKIKNEKITIPKFDRHNGSSAKTRANAAKRQAKKRSQPSRTDRDKNVTRPLPEKRREENKTTPPLTPPTASADHPPHVPEPPCPGAWGGVVSELIDLGVFAPHPAVEAAKAAGASPEQVRAVLDYARNENAAGFRAYGAGAIRNRVMITRPGLDPGQGWPEPSKEYQAKRQAFFEEEKRQRRRDDQAAEDQRAEGQRSRDAELETRLGPVLDAMTRTERDVVAKKTLGKSPVYDRYRREGAVGLPRLLMLAELDKHMIEGAGA